MTNHLVMRTIPRIVAAGLLAASSVAAHAALVGRDLDGDTSTYEAYWDSGRNLTWIADWNLANGSIYDAWGDGRMTWANANAWANGLVYGGFDDWRLPTALSVGGTGPLGCFCSASEMGHLWYDELGNTAGAISSVGPFVGVRLGISEYWTSDEYAADTRLAWSFRMQSGWSDVNYGKDGLLYAVAVRTGDVASVPEPSTVCLVLIATTCMALRIRLPRRTRQLGLRLA